MLADVLDAPVAKLPVSNNINVGENFLDARSLQRITLSIPYFPGCKRDGHTLSSSRQFSKMF